MFENVTCDPILVDSTSVTLGLWDTSGQEELEKLRLLNYPNTDVFLFCYSVGDRASFESITKIWLPEVKQHCSNTPFLLVGTNTDLRKQSKAKTISHEEGVAKGKEIHAVSYLEVSARNMEGLTELFEAASRVVLKKEVKNNKFSSLMNSLRKKSNSKYVIRYLLYLHHRREKVTETDQ